MCVGQQKDRVFARHQCLSSCEQRPYVFTLIYQIRSKHNIETLGEILALLNFLFIPKQFEDFTFYSLSVVGHFLLDLGKIVFNVLVQQPHHNITSICYHKSLWFQVSHNLHESR